MCVLMGLGLSNDESALRIRFAVYDLLCLRWDSLVHDKLI